MSKLQVLAVGLGGSDIRADKRCHPLALASSAGIWVVGSGGGMRTPSLTSILVRCVLEAHVRLRCHMRHFLVVGSILLCFKPLDLESYSLLHGVPMQRDGNYASFGAGPL